MIKIKTNRLEFEWLMSLLKEEASNIRDNNNHCAERCLATYLHCGAKNMHHKHTNTLLNTTKKNITISITPAEAFILTSIIAAAFIVSNQTHEIAWAISIDNKLQTEIDKLYNQCLKTLNYQN